MNTERASFSEYISPKEQEAIDQQFSTLFVRSAQAMLMRTQNIPEDVIREHVANSEEFQKTWGERNHSLQYWDFDGNQIEGLDEFREKVLDILTSDDELTAKALLSYKDFIGAVSIKMIRNRSIGEYTNKIVDFARNASEDDAPFILSASEGFVALDEKRASMQPRDTSLTYLGIEEESEEEKSKRQKYINEWTKAADDMVNTALDGSREGKWPSFLRTHFNFTATQLAMHYFEHYNEGEIKKSINRLQALIKATDEEEHLPIIYYYTHSFGDLFNDVDQEVVSGNPERAITIGQHIIDTKEKNNNIYTEEESRLERIQIREYAKGNLTKEQFLNFHKTLERIDELTEQFLDRTTPDTYPQGRQKAFRSDLKQHIKSLRESHMIHLSDNVQQLFDANIIPTVEILNFLGVGATIDNLQELKQQTENGKFDLSNRVQRDLELLKYFTEEVGRGSASYTSFTKTPYVEDISSAEAGSTLTSREVMEAEAAAYEAAIVYHEIARRHSQGKDVVVVGNERYGKYFVSDPLRPHLTKLGVTTQSHRVSSTSATESDVHEQFSRSFIETLSSANPDVIIIDGTTSPKPNERTTRFPRALSVYLRWFDLYNKAVNDQAWSEDDAQTDDEVDRQAIIDDIRNHKPKKKYIPNFFSTQSDPITLLQLDTESITLDENSETEASPEVVLVCSTSNAKDNNRLPNHLQDHKAGHFDDVDRYTSSSRHVAFTNYGLETVYKGGRTEAELIAEVQDLIEQKLPAAIRETDPLNY